MVSFTIWHLLSIYHNACFHGLNTHTKWTSDMRIFIYWIWYLRNRKRPHYLYVYCFLCLSTIVELSFSLQRDKAMQPFLFIYLWYRIIINRACFSGHAYIHYYWESLIYRLSKILYSTQLFIQAHYIHFLLYWMKERAVYSIYLMANIFLYMKFIYLYMH